jgi:patatin-like phospholipase/acyl hydrolase
MLCHRFVVITGTSTGTITHLVINVENDELYFTIDRVIYRQKMYQTASTLYIAARRNHLHGRVFSRGGEI